MFKSLIEEFLEELRYHKSSFRSDVEKCYKDIAHLPIRKQKQDLTEFFHTQPMPDEGILCRRYRELKYATSQALSDRIGLYISGASSLFIAIAMLFAEEGEFLTSFAWSCVVGAIIAILAAFLIWWAKQVYMRSKVLFLYPLEMELVEEALSKDKAAQSCETPTEPSSDNTPNDADEPNA